jgi:hypothetical protein
MSRRRFPAPPRLALVPLLLVLAAGPAAAARWDTWNNANALNSVNATRGVVWCDSDQGLHRYDPVSGTFTRIPKAPGELAALAVAETEVDAAGRAWHATKGRGVSVQTATGSWRTVNTFDGIPSDTVFCLEPSALGMWVGTSKGLALFDGFELTAVWPDGINESPFAADQILDIAHVGESTWVATARGPYVTRSDEGVSWFVRRDGLSSGDRVQSITGRAGEAWCVAGNRVFRGGQTGTWTPAEEGLPATTSNTIRARGDTLLLGTGAGVFRRIGESPWEPLGAAYPAAAWVDFADDGAPWAGNVEGLWAWNGTAWTRRLIPGPGGNRVNGLALQGSRPWITTLFDGLSTFDGTSWFTYRGHGTVTDTSLVSSDFLFGMFVDRFGRKWIGDWGAAITELDDSGATPEFTHHFDFTEGAFDAHNTFGWSTAQDPGGNVWIGLDTDHFGTLPPPSGLHRFSPGGTRTTFNPQTGTTAMSNSHVRAIAFAPGSGFEMWVGYAVGNIDIFTDPNLASRSGRLVYQPNVQGLLSDDIWAIEFNGDSVWVGTSSGLTRFSRATRGWRESILTESPSTGGAVRPLAIDAEGGVWWATKGGLYHRRPNRSVELFTDENSPLLSNDIRSVAHDFATGDVWIATVSGVQRYNPNITVETPGSGLATFRTYPNPAYLSASGVRLFGEGVTGSYAGRVYDIRGRVVRELLGNASVGGLWNGTDEEGNAVAPGLYFIAITQGDVTRTGRVLLVR